MSISIVELKKAKKIAWSATVIMFVLYLLNIFVIQWNPFVVSDVFLLIFGVTMILDGLVGYQEKQYQLMGRLLRGRWAEVAAGIILVIGIFVVYGGFSDLVF